MCRAAYRSVLRFTIGAVPSGNFLFHTTFPWTRDFPGRRTIEWEAFCCQDRAGECFRCRLRTASAAFVKVVARHNESINKREYLTSRLLPQPCTYPPSLFLQHCTVRKITSRHTALDSAFLRSLDRLQEVFHTSSARSLYPHRSRQSGWRAGALQTTSSCLRPLQALLVAFSARLHELSAPLAASVQLQSRSTHLRRRHPTQYPPSFASKVMLQRSCHSGSVSLRC